MKAIENAKAACIAEIDRQTMPSGADITGENEADFKLLEYGLVTSPGALEKLAAVHDSPAFRTMIRKYADEREWKGFDFHDKEKTLRDFVNDFFDECYRAAHSPRGYYGLLLNQENEIERQAVASGLSAEYQKGMGTNA